MKSLRQLGIIAAGVVLLASAASATDRVTGRLQMVYPSTQAGMVYVRIVGNPVLDGGNCPLYEYLGRMDDTNFKTFVYPALLAAKAADTDVTLIVYGCLGAYPVITGVQYSPAQ